MMDFHEYQRHVLRTSPLLEDDSCYLNWALGLCGESGEIADHIKKAFFQGHELDSKKIAEELGDLLWYVARMANQINVSLEDVAKSNVAKLQKRYPNGFSAEDSVNRRT